MSDDKRLDVFPAEPAKVRAGDEILEIRPFLVGDIPGVMRNIRAIAPLFAAGAGANVDWITLLDEHGEALIDLAAIGSHKSVDWVRALPMADFLQIALAIYQVNMDFFGQRLMPLLRSLTQAPTGPSPSAASSQPDIVGKT